MQGCAKLIMRCIITLDCLPANQKEIRMGRSIPVKIGKKEFKTKKAAVDYFMDQREAVKAVAR
jgi:hypothetical protein